MTKPFVKLYSLSAPLAILPVLGFGFDQIIPFLRGPEFRTLMAEIVTQVFSGAADAIITAAFTGLFG